MANSKNTKKNNNKKEVKDTTKKIKAEKVKVEEVKEKTEEKAKVEEKVKVVKPKVTKEKKKINFDKFLEFVKKVDEHRISIILFVVGFLIATLLFRGILWPDRIATLEDGTQPVVTFDGQTITADDFYTSLKENNSLSVLLDKIDNELLTKKYPDSDELTDEVEESAEYYFSVYESYYGYSESETISAMGYSTKAEFLEALTLNVRRNKYYEEYAESLVTDKEINKYYEDEVYGDVDSKHILVAIDEDDGLSDDEAKALAEEIIKKLNNGTSWDDVVEEYKDQITAEDLGYNAFNANLEEAYLEECKTLKVGSYSKTPVLTSYGYHIVYKIDQKDKPSLDDVKDAIIDELATEKKDADSNLLAKSLIAMREDANLEFSDTKVKEDYDDYVKQYK